MYGRRDVTAADARSTQVDSTSPRRRRHNDVIGTTGNATQRLPLADNDIVITSPGSPNVDVTLPGSGDVTNSLGT